MWVAPDARRMVRSDRGADGTAAQRDPAAGVWRVMESSAGCVRMLCLTGLSLAPVANRGPMNF